MRITSIDFIQKPLDQTYEPEDLFLEVKLKLKALPEKPEAIIFASVTAFAAQMSLYGHRIAHELEISESASIYNITGGCFVGLQALDLAKMLLQKHESVLIVAMDTLKTMVSKQTVEKRASAVRWGDGAAIVMVNRGEGPGQVLGIKMETDHRYSNDFFVNKINYQSCLDFNFSAKDYAGDFAQDDLEKSGRLCRDLAAIHELRELRGLVCVNRSQKFATGLASQLGLRADQVFESFGIRGHLGSADIFMNLKDLMDLKPQGDYLIYSCGYGYTRVAAALRFCQN